jgi:hypothetical protein
VREAMIPPIDRRVDRPPGRRRGPAHDRAAQATFYPQSDPDAPAPLMAVPAPQAGRPADASPDFSTTDVEGDHRDGAG